MVGRPGAGQIRILRRIDPLDQDAKRRTTEGDRAEDAQAASSHFRSPRAVQRTQDRSQVENISVLYLGLLRECSASYGEGDGPTCGSDSRTAAHRGWTPRSLINVRVLGPANSSLG